MNEKWAYYNEFDKGAAAWLRELISRGLIAPGDVDERSIVDVRADERRGYAQCHFFAGIGGWSLALRFAGWPDDRPVWTGSCPCQPFSAAGAGGGFADVRHLWPELFRLTRECRPDHIFGEQVAGAPGLAWLDLVSTDLEGAGYAIGAANLSAAGLGAPHIRQRLYWMAHAENAIGRGGFVSEAQATKRPSGNDEPSRGSRADSRMADTSGAGRGTRRDGRQGDEGVIGHPQGLRGSSVSEPVGLLSATGWADIEWLPCRDGKSRPAQSGVSPLVARLPRGMVHSGDISTPDATLEARPMRLKGYGNAIVPQVAAEFIGAYMDIA